MDALIQGDYYFLVFVCCAAFSIAFRARNPGFFKEDEGLQIPFTKDHQSHQLEKDGDIA